MVWKTAYFLRRAVSFRKGSHKTEGSLAYVEHDTYQETSLWSRNMMNMAGWLPGTNTSSLKQNLKDIFVPESIRIWKKDTFLLACWVYEGNVLFLGGTSSCFYVGSVVLVKVFGLCWGRYLQSQIGRDGEVVAILCEVYRSHVAIQAPNAPTIRWQSLTSWTPGLWWRNHVSGIHVDAKMVKHLTVDRDSTAQNETMNLQELNHR